VTRRQRGPVRPETQASLRSAVAGTWPLLLGMGILMLGAGLQGTLSGVRASLAGFPTATIGLVLSCYYGGFVAGSALAPRLVANVGHVRVFAALTAVASIAVLVQGAFVTPPVWALARATSGVCLAGIYVVAESWLNDRAENRARGSLLSAYMMILYGALGAGQFLLLLADPRRAEPFMLVAGLLALALVPLALSAQRAPAFDVPRKIGLRALYGASPLGVVGVTLSGVATGTLFALGPVYAETIGLDRGEIAAFMAAAILAAVVTQLPVGRLSDRVDRRLVLIGACAVAGGAAAAAAAFGPRSHGVLLAIVPFFGGSVLTIYSLALSHVNDHLSADQMVGASGSLVLLNGAGATAGPLLTATLMDRLGPVAFFAALASECALLAGYALWRMTRTEAVASEQKGTFVAAQPQAPTASSRVGAAESRTDGSTG